ncbi:hypothetical protein C4552_01205 [Candidatus Parcubacteria bacterium]|nr:MAG: hypothetical protein C4552_01205 [Candidatus Parcubacteria bacterium]
MDALDAIFASPARARLLKLFLMNPEAKYSAVEGAKQTRLGNARFAAEAKRLVKLGILQRGMQRLLIPARGRTRAKHVRVEVFWAHREYSLFPELRGLIVKSAPHAKGQLAARVRRLGNVKLAVLAGAFIDNPESRVDLFLVGDGMRQSRMKTFIQWLEGEVGKELNYVAMSTQEFKYRMDMYDRFVRDILEFPHETIINKLGV